MVVVVVVGIDLVALVVPIVVVALVVHRVLPIHLPLMEMVAALIISCGSNPNPDQSECFHWK